MKLNHVQNTNFRLYQFEISAERNFEIDENELKFPDSKKKTVLRKIGNAGYQHFLLFPKCFQNVFLLGSLELVSVRKSLKEDNS